MKIIATWTTLQHFYRLALLAVLGIVHYQNKSKPWSQIGVACDHYGSYAL